MPTFSRVYKSYTFGGGEEGEVSKSTFILYTFKLDFIIFVGIFGTQNMSMCTIFFRGEGVSESVWFVHS